jgi:chaperonin cofactor prefoldin
MQSRERPMRVFLIIISVTLFVLGLSSCSTQENRPIEQRTEGQIQTKQVPPNGGANNTVPNYPRLINPGAYTGKYNPWTYNPGTSDLTPTFPVSQGSAQLSCDGWQQIMNNLQNQIIVDDRLYTDYQRALNYYIVQITILNQQIGPLQHEITNIQDQQQDLYKLANDLQSEGQDRYASGVRQVANALGSETNNLKSQAELLQLRVKGLHVQVTPLTTSLKQELTTINNLTQELANDFGSYEHQCGG